MRGWNLVCVFVGLGVWACSSPGNEVGSVAEAQPAPTATTPGQKLLSAYITVQRRLAADDAKGAKAAFAQLRAAAEAKGVPGDAALRQRIAAAAKSGADAKDIKAARVAFGTSSDAVLEWLRKQGNALASSVRVAHCPMARDGKGGRWVQTESKVQNPYYGSEMLTCGSIEKELEPGAKL